MTVVSHGKTLIGDLRAVAADISDLLSRLDDPRRSRPSTSQERRRLADQIERTTTNLDAICGHLETWIADQPDDQRRPQRVDTSEAACAEVTRANEALDQARTELHRSVETARIHGAPWRQIGEALDITAQTAHKRFDPEARRRHAAYMRERNRRRPL